MELRQNKKSGSFQPMCNTLTFNWHPSYSFHPTWSQKNFPFQKKKKNNLKGKSFVFHWQHFELDPNEC